MAVGDELLVPFLDSIRVSDRTKKIYRGILGNYLRSAGKLPESIAEVQVYLSSRVGKSASTLAVDSAAFRRYLDWAGVPTKRLERIPIQQQPPEYLSLPEIKVLMDHAGSVLLRTLIAVCYDTGARVGEILGLKVADINWDGYLRVRRKGGKEEWVPVSDRALEYMRQLLHRSQKHPRVFGDRTYRDMWAQARDAAKRAGLQRFHFHMLRHSRAVHLREQGVDWVDIAYQLGHVDPGMTIKIYTRLKPEDLRKKIPAAQI